MLAAALELVALGAYFAMGWSLALPSPSSLRLLAGIACVAAMMTAWSGWAAPKSGKRLSGWPLALFKLGAFAGGALSIAMLGHPLAAAIFAGVAVFQIILAIAIRSL
ncbi:DUF2568 domain-containing protein [Altererythrobacter sp. CC-YST694]|uniref:DUF2568 domain-containing protein n=1 Tax=Altererythrobacter sp. CC-YST694 TaxID=2755038 RepID=UPI001D03276C|nr:DUF2568 domain-containing protein [Altererythrobacter sp. CC-YST694]